MLFEKFRMRKAFGKVSVKTEVIVKAILSIDADQDGRISLEEAANAMRLLWKKANGKLKEAKVKQPKVKTLDE